MTDLGDETRTLNEWSRQLTQALQILDLEVDHERIVQVARETADAVSPSAGVVSAFLVGYAAGSKDTRGRKGSAEAVESAADVVMQVCSKGVVDGPDKNGWAKTGQ
ncbi:DUF6457 domain-containing protein [Arthrobacter roseus]|uniref:DUF6457 domain-containing protein n=1 Tax=Arthrobacter roseus TaxID=136274 RepID=UPI001964A1F8|nr:DUF6457 domain-containing protein [Arthrobacter roseus]MBM7847797.1 uncharacterized protein YigA (DUF484 family) [Arthrobacter roseus]